MKSTMGVAATRIGVRVAASPGEVNGAGLLKAVSLKSQ